MMDSWKNAAIKKRLDGSFDVIHSGVPYNVVPREIDPENFFDFEEVAGAWDSLRDGDPGKLAEQDPPPPAEEDMRESRRLKIQTEGAEIDAASVHLVRAILTGNASDADQATLKRLHEQAVLLREELAELG